VTAVDGHLILITGASGFIGRRLAARLTTSGAEVVRWSLRGAHGTESVDLFNSASIRAAMRGRAFDGIVHLASLGRRIGTYEDALADASMLGRFLDLQQDGAASRVLMMGSADEYGMAPAPQPEQAPRVPISPYGLAKRIAHEQVEFARGRGQQVATLRPFSVYGPGQPGHMFIAQVVRACVRGERFEMSHGTQNRDFLWVDDLCDAIEKALTVDSLGSAAYNLGTGHGTSIWDAAQLVLELSGAEIEVVRGSYQRPEDPPSLVADPSLARRELNWEARTSLREGLTMLINEERRRGAG
jgi:nucleoside-diphosphate-sugar epimerase